MCLHVGRGQGHVTHSKFLRPNHISGRLKTESPNFVYTYKHIKCYHWDDKLFRNGHGTTGHVTRFLILALTDIFGIGEAKHFKCRMFTHKSESAHGL